MKFPLRKIVWICIVIVVLPIIYIGITISVAFLTEFRPAPVQDIALLSNASTVPLQISKDSSLTFFTWNIGYGGLGAETDFFYDGGKMSIAPKEWVEKYTQGIFATAKQNSDADFLFFQEVDRKGNRSYYIDEVAGIMASLSNVSAAFALNYDVKFMPMPLLSPMGRIYSGLLSCSKYTPTLSQRIALPDITDFPRKLFYLKRCLLLQRYKVSNGKEFVVINTHFEAYDEGGRVKKEQMAVTRRLLETEYNKGNYVVLGGDWNIAPPGFNIHKWEKEKINDPLYMLQNDSVYIPGWQFVADRNTPTNRKNNHAFDPLTTFTTVIDYFYISPNIDVEKVEGVNAEFKYSDHNPVKMKIKLK